jgi:hypothetical protein
VGLVRVRFEAGGDLEVLQGILTGNLLFQA